MSANGTSVGRRYSRASKLKVVSEIESGKYTISQARRIYDIGGAHTVYKWLRKFGKGHLIERIVRVEMKDEKDKLKELELKNRKLESALADAHLKLICWESLIECVEEHYQIDVKKTLVPSCQTNTYPGQRKSVSVFAGVYLPGFRLHAPGLLQTLGAFATTGAVGPDDFG